MVRQYNNNNSNNNNSAQGSVMSDSVTPCIAAHQAPWDSSGKNPSCWSGLLFPTPGDLPNPGIQPTSPALAGGFFATEPPGKPNNNNRSLKYCV